MTKSPAVALALCLALAASGQVSIAIPDLGLVIAFTGGNYNDAVLFTGQRVYVPTYILPAVR